ncbi:MAG: Ca2+-transporting ATPase [Psychromonas sp.]|jgi:Ca2+-transporting ATPase|uniref:cation-translocating P-type ATPase n=1 Tax=Psychromonas sp. TaxID=1884585 RepID=UPI0039E597D5
MDLDKQESDGASFYRATEEDVLHQLDVNSAQGLSQEEVRKRQQQYGPNELQEETTPSPYHILVNQFKSIVILILVAAAAVAFITDRWPEGLALIAVTLINTAIGFFSEYKAVRSMEALRRLGQHKTSVRRQGEVQEIAASELVPGDIVLLGNEDLVPADLRLLGSKGARGNEAALTGESMPVNKSSDSVDAEAALHERSCMLYKGTSIIEGEVEGVVTAIGISTEIGRISQLTAAAKKKAPPLQKRLDQLGKRLAWVTLAIAVIIGAAGLAVGRDTVLMIETAIALGIAAIPEGLPIVATIALARGMWLMAKHNALVNRLTAVETLGATSIILTDKTGTLTENKMAVTELVTPLESMSLDTQSEIPVDQQKKIEKLSIMRLLKIGALCSNARPDEEGGYSGDPTEVALLKAALQKGIEWRELAEKREEEHEVPFDSETMMMATFHPRESKEGAGTRYYVSVKGAPDQVLQACGHILTENGSAPMSDEQHREWRKRVDDLAAKGLRLLAFADKEVADISDKPYKNLCFVGLAAMEDPPRTDVREAIEQCQAAGIRVVMVTGDRADTGSAIAEKVGLNIDGKAFHGKELSDLENFSAKHRKRIQAASVFARVTPEQKFNLVKLYQENGQIIAMTGDGINDAPALKQADIGIAMGRRGTDAAKQVADMVLRDDKFSTIVAAVKEGRIIFANIRKSVIFMLCTNIAEVLAVALASLAQLPIPLNPLQILYLNVLTDVFPALALGLGLGSSDVMKRLPREPDEAVLTSHHWRSIGIWSLIIGAIVLAALTISLFFLGVDEKQAVTISFLTLAFAKLWFVVNLRDRGTPVLLNDVTTNHWIWLSWGICIVLLVLAVYWTPLSAILQTVSPGVKGWCLILGLSLVPVALGAIVPGIRFYSTAKRQDS